MKKKLYYITAALAALSVLSLSSCLKDSRYVDFSQGGTVINFPKGGLANFSGDAITSSADTIVQQFAVEIASPTVPTSSTDITVAVDNTIVTSYNATETAVNYLPMPAGSYTLSATKVTVPAGQRSAAITVTFYRGLLDPSKSYMLPIKIVSATDGGIISGNYGIHYYHFIGNDFAGSYRWQFERWNASDSTSAPLNGASFGFAAGNTATFLPVSPTEFTVKSGYAGNLVSYDVTFTKNADGTYSNFAVQILPSDDAVLTGDGITLVQQPVFLPSAPSAASYTYAQAITLFHFQWVAATSSNRYLVDYYIK
jgi:hypothetical protein